MLIPVKGFVLRKNLIKLIGRILYLINIELFMTKQLMQILLHNKTNSPYIIYTDAFIYYMYVNEMVNKLTIIIYIFLLTSYKQIFNFKLQIVRFKWHKSV